MSQDSKKNPLLDTRGRATETNEVSRFDREQRHVDLDSYGWADEEHKSLVRTQFLKDSSRTIVNENDSPDIPFRYSMNFYRGCEHGCIYCYARPTHEYLGLSAGLDFESKIFVKEDAPELLREKLMSPRWEPESITVSGVTDCYQPAERKFELTRKCLQVLAEFRNPVVLITKNQLITRDIDVLKELAEEQLVIAFISITTLDPELARVMEPRTSSPQGRLSAVRRLAEAGIPVGVMVAPIIPGLTDHEIPAILKAAAEAGAYSAGHTVVRLPHSVKDLFAQWLETNRPDAKEKVLKYIREVRGGKLNDPGFGSRMRGDGPRADNIHQLFHTFAEKYGLSGRSHKLRTDKFRRPGDQLQLF